MWSDAFKQARKSAASLPTALILKHYGMLLKHASQMRCILCQLKFLVLFEMLKAYPGSKYVPLPTLRQKKKKLTYTYKSLQFPVEINPFYTQYDLQGQSFDYRSLNFKQFQNAARLENWYIYITFAFIKLPLLWIFLNYLSWIV